MQAVRFYLIYVRKRYEIYLSKTVVKAPNHYWSIEEDKILIDCLFKDSSMKNPKYISSILLSNVRDSKANEKISRSTECISTHYKKLGSPSEI